MTLQDEIAAAFGNRAENPTTGDRRAERPGASTSGANSICAAIDIEAARIESLAKLRPVPITELGDGEPVSWAWYGYLAREHVTLLIGLWKAGKTTLIAHLLRVFGDGGELAGRVEPTRVLIISEESPGLWRKRRDEIGLGPHVHVLCRPFIQRPRGSEWVTFIALVAQWVRDNDYGVVIFDTLTSLWPVSDENDAAKVLSALIPLHEITATGAAVLLSHHPRKGDASEGQAARGSGALPGFVDIILELRRLDATRRDDHRRTLTAYSRFDETPSETVIELTDVGYRTVGSKADAKQCDRLEAIAELLPSDPPGMVADDVLSAWPDGGLPKPGKRTVQLDLKLGAENGRWSCAGSGTKGDPIRYWLPNSIRADTTS